MSCKYLIVFDTNVLFKSYSTGDVARFAYNSKFDMIMDKIESLDIYTDVSIGIPEIVHRELMKQNSDSYYEKIHEIEKAFSQNSFPLHSLIIKESPSSFEEHLRLNCNSYYRELDSRQCKVEKIPLPPDDKFQSLIERALQKRPPFEGRDKHSDKGFKDALIWESILEYKRFNPETQIILYSKDGVFNRPELKREFQEAFGETFLVFTDKHEAELLSELETMAQKLTNTSYIPPAGDEESITRWVNSPIFAEDFSEAFLDEENEHDYLSVAEVIPRNLSEIIFIEEKDSCIEYQVILDVFVRVNVLGGSSFTRQIATKINVRISNMAISICGGELTEQAEGEIRTTKKTISIIGSD